MYKTRILIISNRKELSFKYKKLIENLKQEVQYTNNLSEALQIIKNYEVEFIIISDTIKEKLSDFIKKIRALTYNFRPIIIAVSKSSDLKDKLEILNSGADDFLGEELSKQELKMRFRAHLRRYVESYLNPITHLFDRKITIKALKQSLFNKINYSYILIKINEVLQYRKTHGEIAYEKAIKTLGAITTSVLSEDDFCGHLADDEILLIVNPFFAEQISSFLTFAFDNILNKFYSKDEYNNNFAIQSADNKEENRCGLMRLNIVSLEKNNVEQDFRKILNNLWEMINTLNKTPKAQEQSMYMIDRTKLKGSVTKKIKNKILIFEKDYALSYLLKNVCELNEITAISVFNKDEFFEIYNNFNPDVVILDWKSELKSNLYEITKKISNDNVKIIFSSSFLNKKEILKLGADLYIPKPYEIDEIINKIKHFLL